MSSSSGDLQLPTKASICHAKKRNWRNLTSTLGVSIFDFKDVHLFFPPICFSSYFLLSGRGDREQLSFLAGSPRLVSCPERVVLCRMWLGGAPNGSFVDFSFDETKGIGTKTENNNQGRNFHVYSVGDFRFVCLLFNWLAPLHYERRGKSVGTRKITVWTKFFFLFFLDFQMRTGHTSLYEKTNRANRIRSREMRILPQPHRRRFTGRGISIVILGVWIAQIPLVEDEGFYSFKPKPMLAVHLVAYQRTNKTESKKYFWPIKARSSGCKKSMNKTNRFDFLSPREKASNWWQENARKV